MSIRNLLAIVIAFTLVLASCSKHSTTAHTTKVDMGVVPVSNGQTTIHDLGNGQICTMKSTVFTNGTILLDMKVERAGKTLSKPRIQTTSGIPVAIEVGEVSFALTPVTKP